MVEPVEGEIAVEERGEKRDAKRRRCRWRRAATGSSIRTLSPPTSSAPSERIEGTQIPTNMPGCSCPVHHRLTMTSEMKLAIRNRSFTFTMGLASTSPSTAAATRGVWVSVTNPTTSHTSAPFLHITLPTDERLEARLQRLRRHLRRLRANQRSMTTACSLIPRAALGRRHGVLRPTRSLGGTLRRSSTRTNPSSLGPSPRDQGWLVPLCQHMLPAPPPRGEGAR